MKEVPTIWTIGHSNLHFFNFAKQLLEHKIKVLVDVRSRPYSRYAPQFNRTALEMQLSRLGITYIFKGQNLGGKDKNIDFEQNIQWLCEQASKEENTAIMCTEKDYRKCHRHQMIEKELKNMTFSVCTFASIEKAILQSHELLVTTLDGVRPWRCKSIS